MTAISDKALAEKLYEAEAAGDGTAQAEALNEICARAGIPLDLTEQGLTLEADEAVEKFLYAAAGEGHRA